MTIITWSEDELPDWGRIEDAAEALNAEMERREGPDASAYRLRYDAVRAIVLAYIGHLGPDDCFSPEDVSSAFRLDPGTVEEALDDLLRDGYLTTARHRS